MASVLAPIGMVASLAGSAFGAAGQYQSGMAASQMYQYQAGIADYNRKIAEQNAEYAVNAGQTQAAQAGMKYRALIGQTRARQGASNIAVGEGSSADVVAGEKEISRIDTANILNNAARVAYGYKVEGQQATMQGQLDTMASAGAARAAPIAAAGSLISGVGSVASKWYQAQTSGIPIFGAG